MLTRRRFVEYSALSSAMLAYRPLLRSGWAQTPGRPLRLAILFGAAAPSSSGAHSLWDETRLPNQVIRAAADRPSPQNDASLLQRLVPGH